jgi:hypothetical protein
MQEDYRHIGQCSSPERDRVGARERRNTGRSNVAAFLDGDTVEDRLPEKRPEQQHSTRVAIGEQMRKRPDLAGDQYRVAQPTPDPPRRGIHARQRHEGEPH